MTSIDKNTLKSIAGSTVTPKTEFTPEEVNQLLTRSKSYMLKEIERRLENKELRTPFLTEFEDGKDIGQAIRGLGCLKNELFMRSIVDQKPDIAIFKEIIQNTNIDTLNKCVDLSPENLLSGVELHKRFNFLLFSFFFVGTGAEDSLIFLDEIVLPFLKEKHLDLAEFSAPHDPVLTVGSESGDSPPPIPNNSVGWHVWFKKTG